MMSPQIPYGIEEAQSFSEIHWMNLTECTIGVSIKRRHVKGHLTMYGLMINVRQPKESLRPLWN